MESSLKRSPLALVVVAFVVALMLYFGYHHARKHPGVAGAAFNQSTIAPDFSLESLDGKTTRLSDFRGKAVLLNFWATWCGPCKIEMPWFVDLQKQYGSQGLQIVGVAMDDGSKEDIAKFAKAPFQEPGLRDSEIQKSYYNVATGLIAGNVYLFAASQGLAAWFHNCNKTALAAELKLRPEQRVLYAQTVGYPAKG